MRMIFAVAAALSAVTLVGGCADDLSGPGNLMFDANCSGNGLSLESYCTSINHPLAGPYGTAERDSTWHQFDDQRWLNIE